jgi:NTE family protein
MQIGLALGGGGAKGFFHIGVLKALEKLNVKIDLIVGTSMGAVVGGHYSLYPDAAYVERSICTVFERYSKDILALKDYAASPDPSDDKDVFLEKAFSFVKSVYVWHLHIIKPYLASPKPFIRIFKDMFGNSSFSDCKIPFLATSVDLVSGEANIINEGLLHRAVMASSALPGIFPPLAWKDKLLVDGGVLLTFPAEVIKTKSNFIIGVNVEEPWSPAMAKSAIDVLFLADRVRHKKILSDSLKNADFLLYPDINDISWLDFDKIRELIRRGETAMLEKEAELTKAMKRHKIKRFFLIK